VPEAPLLLERSERDSYWLVDAELAPSLEALGWPDTEAVAGALRAAGSDGRAATAVLALPDRPERVHLRPVRHGGLLGPLWSGAILGTKRPARELHVTARLFGAGAPVPRPVLVAARRLRGPFWSAVVGSVHAEDARDGVAWLEAHAQRMQISRAARAVGAAVRRFHDAGGAHADLHAKNLLLRERGDDIEVLVIDLDGALAGEPPPPERRMRELMRLVRGLHKRGLADRVGPRGFAAAFSAYCAGDRALRRALRAHLPRERRRLARHRRLYR
jgi:3-deoxy-D-manno-octulosonic acid kinase